MLIERLLDLLDPTVIFRVDRYNNGDIETVFDPNVQLCEIGDFPFDIAMKDVTYLNIANNKLIIEYNDD